MSDRAKKFGVNQPAIFYALKRRNFSWKKKQLRYRERNREERIQYYQLSLEILSKKLEVKALYLLMNQDLKKIKTVFMPGQKKGKIYGEQEGKRGKRENLVAGRRKKEKDLIAPIIFKVTLNAVGFEQWYGQHLLPSLKIPNVLIMDNSPIHRK